MKKLLFIVLITSLCMISCTNKKAGVPGIDLSDMDTTMLPSVDFYQYANGGWMIKNPLPAEYARYGSFDQLGENVEKQLVELVKDLTSKEYPKGSVSQKMGDLYAVIMDTATLKTQGAQPIQSDLIELSTVSDKQALIVYMAGMYSCGTPSFFSLFVAADDKNSDMNILQMYQSGLGIGDRDYYLKEDDRNKEIRAKYVEHIIKMFVLCGYSQEDATVASTDIMEIETRLAKSFTSREDLRDPYKNYHIMTLADLKQQTPAWDWDLFFQSMNVSFTKLNVCQESALKEIVKVYDESDLQALKNYLAWRIINSNAGCLSEEIALQNFEFYGKTLSGRTEIRPRWKRAISVLDGTLGEALGMVYVDKYFPAESKARMLELVSNLQTSLGERIQQLAWMSDETKVKALEKLSAFHVKIGYPDKWKDYTALSIDKNQSYYENMKNVGRFYFQDNISKIEQPVDRDEWFMTPQTVNAYYNPTTNEICFPAGILQPPFFNKDADDAVNYGAIGVVIGHEMTHGFDDQGRQYDKNGNLSNWWTEEDAVRFVERAKALAEYFNKIEVAPGTFANGAYTLGENIADHGGLQVAFNAYKNTDEYQANVAIDGLTPAQRFFIGYAHVWADNIREQEILRRVAEDPHSLGRWRVNGSLKHIPAFFEAFNIQEGDPMYLPEAERVSIW